MASFMASPQTLSLLSQLMLAMILTRQYEQSGGITGKAKTGVSEFCLHLSQLCCKQFVALIPLTHNKNNKLQLLC